MQNADHLRERVGLKLDQDATAVALDRAYAQRKFFRDFAAGISFGDQFGDTALALCEPRKPARDPFTRPRVAAALVSRLIAANTASIKC